MQQGGWKVGCKDGVVSKLRGFGMGRIQMYAVIFKQCLPNRKENNKIAKFSHKLKKICPLTEMSIWLTVIIRLQIYWLSILNDPGEQARGLDIVFSGSALVLSIVSPANLHMRGTEIVFFFLSKNDYCDICVEKENDTDHLLMNRRISLCLI